MYAGHLWEGSRRVNGAGSFTERYGKGKSQSRPRDLDTFQTVAVDIFGEATPSNQKSKRPLWKSLQDLQLNDDNPFGDGSEVEIFALTKAKS